MSKHLAAIFALLSLFSSYCYSQDLQEEIVRKNSIVLAQDFYFTLTLSYERIITLQENLALSIKGSLGRDYGNLAYVAIGESSLLLGKHKNFFEPGIAFQYPVYFDEESGDSPLIAIRAGYRYQALSGFQFRVYPMFLIETSPEPDSWGNLPWLGFSFGYQF